jgi:hypothetical protein
LPIVPVILPEFGFVVRRCDRPLILRQSSLENRERPPGVVVGGHDQYLARTQRRQASRHFRRLRKRRFCRMRAYVDVGSLLRRQPFYVGLSDLHQRFAEQQIVVVGIDQEFASETRLQRL